MEQHAISHGPAASLADVAADAAGAAAMAPIDLAALLLTVAALASYLNHRFLKLPATIGLMVIGLGLSLALVALGNVSPASEALAVRVLESVDFDRTLMDALLGFLLFAGALHVELEALMRQRWVIAVLATLGLVLSTAIVGCGTWLLLGAFGIEAPLVVCLVFGALISPTDPIAVLSILHSLGAPEELETQIAGESLFNDGVAVVLFLGLLAAAGLDAHHGDPNESLVQSVGVLFAIETVGGVAFGLAIGAFTYRLLATVDSFEVEILLSLALVAGGYSAARALHVSGPLAMVVAGLLIGNHGRAFAMSDATRDHLDNFWKLVDEILNAVLFVLIGLEVLVLTFDATRVAIGALVIPLVVLARAIAVGTPISLLGLRREFPRGVVPVLTWGGLRGGISVALALSLDGSLGQTDRALYELLVVVTYVVVVFSILVQGLTIGPLLERLGFAGGRTVAEEEASGSGAQT